MLVEGILLSDWLGMFSSCHDVTDNGLLSFIAWPNGKSYLEQDNIVISMFIIMRNIYMSSLDRKMKKISAKSRRRGRR